MSYDYLAGAFRQIGARNRLITALLVCMAVADVANRIVTHCGDNKALKPRLFLNLQPHFHKDLAGQSEDINITKPDNLNLRSQMRLALATVRHTVSSWP